MVNIKDAIQMFCPSKKSSRGNNKLVGALYAVRLPYSNEAGSLNQVLVREQLHSFQRRRQSFHYDIQHLDIVAALAPEVTDIPVLIERVGEKHPELQRQDAAVSV